eukprot:TRINITY_DN13484_c0_g1_i1.p2 TRINITY_DN13484_c0_g1~~TRINITY_DN13484_c0_g1_i1.p2  ORF type:complete len:66 (+),score=8.58 TRINITY_DN13484_c0_g1_i1:218-415(+)
MRWVWTDLNAVNTWGKVYLIHSFLSAMRLDHGQSRTIGMFQKYAQMISKRYNRKSTPGFTLKGGM